MKNAGLKIIIFLFVIPIFTLPIFADSVTGEISSSIKDELEEFRRSLPNDVAELIPSKLFDGDFSSLSAEALDEKSLIDAVTNYVLIGFDDVINSFVGILCVLIIASVFNVLGKSFSSSGIKNTFALFSSACVSLTVFNVCVTLCNRTAQYIRVLCGVMNSFVPVMTSIYIMSGRISSAAAANVSMAIFISLIEDFLLVALLPAVQICTCLSIVGSVGENDLSGISKVIKNTFTAVIVFVMSLFMFIFSGKNLISQASDSVSLRTVKFAIGSFIPIVGSSVGDALKTVSAGLTLVKNSCGVMALVTIGFILIPVIISLILNRMSFGICSGIASLTGCKKEAKLISEADSICGFMLAMVTCTAILFVFAIAVFIKSSSEVIQ